MESWHAKTGNEAIVLWAAGEGTWGFPTASKPASVLSEARSVRSSCRDGQPLGSSGSSVSGVSTRFRLQIPGDPAV